MLNDDESNHFQGEGMRIKIPSNTIDINTRLEVLLGLNLSRHTDTLTEASNLIDDLCKIAEIQNEKHYRNALDKFDANKVELPSKLLKQIAFNAEPKKEEHLLIVMDKSKHEEYLPQTLQTKRKQHKTSATF